MACQARGGHWLGEQSTHNGPIPQRRHGVIYCTAPLGVAHNDDQHLDARAGVEQRFGPSWLVRLPFRYADFGNANPAFLLGNVGIGGDDRAFATVHVQTHTVSLGAASKF
jgi:hypothetical protein